MKVVTLYAPINRELLDEIFQSAAIANSYRRIGNGAYQIEMRDTSILTRFNQPHAVINLIDLKNEIERKEKKYKNISIT
jgi:hypothetical protein